MADKCNTYQHPIIRDGWSQGNRQIDALRPESFHLMDLQPEDWLNFARELGLLFRYYNLDPSRIVPEDWQSFWPDQDSVRQLLKKENQQGELEPHLALYLSFLRLMEHSRSHFNQLNGKHLNFYYRRVLGLSELPHRPDQIHVLFQLAKRVEQQLVSKGTLVDAGKDASGKPLYYAMDEDVVINRASIAHLRQIYYKKGGGLFHAPIANSVDGLGAELAEENPQWSAFGHTDLPRARIGFAIAAEELALKEGNRLIRVDLNFTGGLSGEIAADFNNQFSVFLSGEKEWLGPFSLLRENQILQSNRLNQTEVPGDLTFYLELDEGVEAVAPYQAEVHGENYNTLHPVLRLMLNDLGNESSIEFYQKLRPLALKTVKITIEVYGVRDLIAENDNSPLDPAKPFLPFGPVPKVGSNFYVGSQEIFSKNWQQVRMNISWKDKPVNFGVHYENYVAEVLNTDGSLSRNVWDLAKLARKKPDEFNGKTYTPYVEDNLYFKTSLAYREKGNWVPSEKAESLFAKAGDDQTKTILIKKQYKPVGQDKIKPVYNKINHIGTSAKVYAKRSNLSQFVKGSKVPKPSFKVANYRLSKVARRLEVLNWSSFPKKGFLKLQLQDHFFFNAYHAIKNLFPVESKLGAPNEPYIPTIEELKVDYSASVSQSFSPGKLSNLDIYQDFSEKKIQLFHDQVFGQTEEHPFLKQQQRSFKILEEVRLLPQHRQGGELLIGLQDAAVNQTISLLIEVANGSENPERESLNPETGIKWFILCSDEWKPLEAQLKLKDTTNQFLRSGIVRFIIPEEATDKNASLEDGFFWLKARLEAPIDSVGRLLGVYAQAASASFVDRDNDLSHLRSGLAAGSATKLKDRLARIKKVEQPYASFGGRPAEDSTAFYQRVSERLRHKDRAVTIWDYEHLILQEFPEVYKVKCLSHTNAKSGKALAPGWVSMIIIPKIHPDNAFDRLRPRAGQQLLTEVEQFLSERMSLHVKFDAVVAEFEEVKLEFGVRFVKGVDPDYHQEKLRTALIGFLSPWTADPDAEIHFGGTIYRSIIVRFLENLWYVDYIDELKIIHSNAEGTVLASGNLRKVVASNARTILVSAKDHKIEILQTDCP